MRSILTSRIHLLALLGGIALVAAACSSSGAATAAPTAAPSTAASAAASVAAAPKTYTVVVANGTIGAYLTGDNGKALYTFKPDSANTSTCTGACAQSWPPFTVTAADTVTAGTGVTGKLATFARPDGTMQVAYDGAPLYYYAKDTKAGDTTGQGVGGKWFVASPAGATPSQSGSSAAPSSSGKYGSSY